MSSKVIELPRRAPPPKMHRRIDGGGGPVSARFASGELRSMTGSAAAEQPAPRVRPDNALPLNNFLKDLHREKRRAERSEAPLSLILYRIDEKSALDSHQAAHLVEMLHRMKRVTDILGHVGDDVIAVLCPDTDEEGTKGFMQKIEVEAGDLPFVGVAATYPDDIFESLGSGTSVQPTVAPFLVSDSLGKRDGAYPLKRALDIVGALTALCIFGPLMMVVAAVVALTSPGPIIFKQKRVGQGGYPFTFYKFRSMTTGADDSIHREFVANLIKKGEGEGDMQEGHPVAYKMRADPRVTPIGRVIRKTSLDELPQLFNVLKGDMSLVGPRPPIPYEAAHYQPWHLRRVLTLKPGMTGIWQVEGRSKVSFNEMVRMDLRYIRKCSLWLDVSLLVRTVLTVVRGDGAT